MVVRTIQACSTTLLMRFNELFGISRINGALSWVPVTRGPTYIAIGQTMSGIMAYISQLPKLCLNRQRPVLWLLRKTI